MYARTKFHVHFENMNVSLAVYNHTNTELCYLSILCPNTEQSDSADESNGIVEHDESEVVTYSTVFVGVGVFTLAFVVAVGIYLYHVTSR